MVSKVVETFLELIKIDTISKNERQIADLLIKKLSNLGLEVNEDNTGEKINGNTGNILGKLKGNINKPSLLFMAHMDTVEPGNGKVGIIENGYIKSAGETILGSDDLAGISIIITTLEKIISEKKEYGDIHIIFTVAEEIGLLGARHLEIKDLKIDYGFILDSNGSIGTICVKAPTQDSLDIKITGIAAHAGVEPEKGINAIVVASDAISKMQVGRIDSETTSNIGLINGGKATNIVCDEVIIKGEARSHSTEKLNKQVDHMRKCFEESAKKYNAKLNLKVKREYLSYNIDKTEEIIKLAEKAGKDIGIEIKTIESGGGSDTNILNEIGVRSVNIGIGMENVHSKNERIKIEDLEKGVEFIESIIKNV